MRGLQYASLVVDLFDAKMRHPQWRGCVSDTFSKNPITVSTCPHCLSRRGNSVSLDPWAKKSRSRWQSAPHTQAIADESGTHSQRFQTPLHSGAQRLHRLSCMTTGV